MAPDVKDKEPTPAGSKKPGREGMSSGEEPSSIEEQAFFNADGDDEFDPELLQLPRRNKRRRHPLISLLVIGLSLYLMVFVRQDLIFFLQPREPQDVGDAATALKAGRLKPNTHVKLSGAPDRKHALIMEGRLGGYESFFRLLQTENSLFVQQHRSMRSTDSVVTATHSGQLVRFDSLPYKDGLRSYFAKTMTIPHDLDFHAVARAKAAKTPRVMVEDRGGVQIELNPESVLWINVVYPNEWLIQLNKRTFETAELAARKLMEMELKLPLARDDEESAAFWRFVVHAEPDQVPLLMARFKDQDKRGNVVRRQLSYSARWSQIGVEGEQLIIDAADPSFPTRYEVAPDPSGGSALVSAKPGRVAVPKEGVLFITTSSPFTIAPDALVLLTDRVPGDYWYYALLYVVLLIFILLNGVALLRRWRERAAAERPSSRTA